MKCEWKDGEFEGCDKLKFRGCILRDFQVQDKVVSKEEVFNFCPFCGVDIRKSEEKPLIVKSGGTWVSYLEGVDYLWIGESEKFFYRKSGGKPSDCLKNIIQIIEFDVAIFEEKIFICISPSIDSLKKFFPKSDLSLYNDTHLGLSFGAIHEDKDYRRVIWIKYWNISTFIHEAYHTTKYILDHKNITDHETGAFLIEFIYDETVKCRGMIAKDHKLQNKA